MTDAQLITATRLATLMRCPRLHRLTYEDLIEPAAEQRGARAWGTVMHRGLEAWFCARRDGEIDPLGLALSAIIASPELDDVERARAVVAMVGYDFCWRSVEMTVLAVEVEFCADMPGLELSRPYRQGGKLDAIVEVAGQVWIVEHKTSTDDIEPGSPYWQRLRLDTQVSIYLEGARALGYQPAGCIYDVIKRPGQELKSATPDDVRRYTVGKGCKECGGSAGGKRGVAQGSGVLGTGLDAGMPAPLVAPCGACSGSGWIEAPRLHSNQRTEDETIGEFIDRIGSAIAAHPDEYYVRGEVIRTRDEMATAVEEIRNATRMIDFAHREDCSPRNPAACAQFRGSVCPMFDLCSGAASVDGIAYRFRQAAHPELAGNDQRANEMPKEIR